MKTSEQLKGQLLHLDGKSYGAYKSLRGAYAFPSFELWIDHVQGDPFASPSHMRVKWPHRYPEWALRTVSRRIALCDYLTRQFVARSAQLSKGNRGSGRSGAILMAQPGQEVLERTTVIFHEAEAEARFQLGLPAFGRRIAGREAVAVLLEELPAIVARSLPFAAQEEGPLREHLLTNEDADALRAQLDEMGLAAFIADGAILPRASGVDQRPLAGGIPFESPPSLRVEAKLPNRTLTGLGIPKGVTLIVGGGFHGKSTLLRAIALGVYNHLPGDGREFVVSQPLAAQIRAEDGRFVAQADISPFISHLPGGKPAHQFSTANASGSTSQAANLVEALEAGATALLIDEDTSATNFMIRDERMRALIPDELEPIQPFVYRVRELFEAHSVSTVLVIGGSGQYLGLADTVVGMQHYRPVDLTVRAQEVARTFPQQGSSTTPLPLALPQSRRPRGSSLNAQKGKGEKVRALGTRVLQFGQYDIELGAVGQLVEEGQLHAIGQVLQRWSHRPDGGSLANWLDEIMGELDANGLHALQPQPEGALSAFRRLELAAALNRLRSLKVD
ncbi:ABC-ATPase domain-containing protein [Phaeodactylibacter luteus]|uniref:ATPase n=1 Tax=Phaeodactylibacter luteus TaxID=1564516 RepID=A0A5C6S193_9BACT|nr:ABC-ATPase domain-containing protein [Phaeodactylibacter luteus]TXB68378.1 ATPase [Phaeodactylibacter luteus]